MEFVWQPFYKHLNASAQIYTYAMYDHYCYFDGFWWDDRFYGDSPVVTDPNLETFNADWKTDLLLAKAYEMLEVYQGNHILMTQGCDFTHANSRQNFMSLDRLLQYFNAHVDNMTLIYSTPGIYLDAIKAQNLSYPVNQDDMFPYADNANDYWTGYFTSRANSKGQVREGQANLHAANKLYAMKAINPLSSDADINATMAAQYSMLDSLGIYQHHDAVTGTAKQHVADDYTYRMYKSMMQVNNPQYARVLQDMIISQKTLISSANWAWCDRLNGTYLDCPVNQSPTSDFLAAMHNPSMADMKYVKIKVPHGHYQVKVWDPTAKVFVLLSKAAVICVPRMVESMQLVNDCDLHVKTLVPAKGFQLLKIAYNSQVDLTVAASKSNAIAGFADSLVLRQTDQDGAHFDLLKQQSGKAYHLTFDIRNYFSYQGGGFVGQGSYSGAYIFRPSDYIQSSV